MLDLLIILFWQFIREQRDLIPRDKEIMLVLEPCGGGAIIARRTLYCEAAGWCCSTGQAWMPVLRPSERRCAARAVRATTWGSTTS